MGARPRSGAAAHLQVIWRYRGNQFAAASQGDLPEPFTAWGVMRVKPQKLCKFLQASHR